MEWEGREESSNVEDRRGLGVGKKAGIAIGGAGSVIVVILALLLGVDPRQLVGPAVPGGQQEAPRQPSAEEDRLAHFTKVVFRDTEVVWDDLFRRMGRQYQKPKMVMFDDQVNSACGTADSAVGPFYCPGDACVYIDLSFYRDMERKLGAKGEFARAYVIAHEVGHHVQRLLGYSARAEETRGRKNEKSVRLELQADYFAGVWAYHGQKRYKFLEPGDLESAMNAANAIGDDRLQKQARGRVVPDSFTHGTSQQRMRWFQAGFTTGDVPGARQLFDLNYDEL